jgi:hypothetical protein
MTSGAASQRPNRRLSARRTCLLSVRYRLGKDWHPATVVNMSSQGCRLRLGQHLERDTRLQVEFETPLRDGATALNADVEGTVTWSRLEGLSYQAGIQFTSLPDALQDLLDSLG